MNTNLAGGFVKPYRPRKFESFIEKLIKVLLDLLRINGSTWHGVRFCKVFDGKTRVIVNNTPIVYHSYHPRLSWRYNDTFTKEEPLGLHWLNSLSSNDVLYDVGANVGIFSITASVLTGCSVVSIEPDPLNYALLISHIVSNGLSEKIIPIPLPLWNKPSLLKIHYRSLSPGDALQGIEGLSRFSHDSIKENHTLWHLSMDLNQMLETYCLPRPTALKIDTDGGEYAILSMFMNNPTVVKTIYLEDNKDDEAALCQELLISRGYSIVSQNDQNPEDQTPFSGSRQTIYSK